MVLINRTLQQFNLFGDKISAAQRLAISLLVNGSIRDSAKRDDQALALRPRCFTLGSLPHPRRSLRSQPGPRPPNPLLWFPRQTDQLFGPGNCTLGAWRAGSLAWK